MATCVVTNVGSGMFTTPGGKLRLTIVDTKDATGATLPNNNTTFVPANCTAWDATDPTNPVQLTGGDAPTVDTTNKNYTITLKPASSGKAITYQLQLAFKQVPPTSKADVTETPCGQAVTSVNSGKLGQQLLIQVV